MVFEMLQNDDHTCIGWRLAHRQTRGVSSLHVCVCVCACVCVCVYACVRVLHATGEQHTGKVIHREHMESVTQHWVTYLHSMQYEGTLAASNCRKH
jgi:hypothetical protein